MEVEKLVDNFKTLVDLDQCVVSSVCHEWDCLKAYILPMITGVISINYLEVWSKFLADKDVRINCSNVLHITEFFSSHHLSTPNLRGCLVNLITSKQISTILSVKVASKLCYESAKKVPKSLRLMPIYILQPGMKETSGESQQPNHIITPPKCKSSNDLSSGVIDIAKYTLSDLEDED